MAKRAPRFPDRKISETMLDFARLTPDALPSEAPERRANAALMVASAVWNAVIFADLLDDHRHLDHIRRLSAGAPELAVLVEQLIARKRTLFAGDERLIGNFEVTRTVDGINVHAEARNPHSLPRNRDQLARLLYVQTGVPRQRQRIRPEDMIPLKFNTRERELILNHTFADNDLTRPLRIVPKPGESITCRFTLD